MIYPKFIKEGSKIGVPAPSDGAYDELKVNKFKNAKVQLEKLGYNIEFSKNIFNNNKGRSADAQARANEFNDMINNDDIDAIICAAGGEFLIEILPYLNFEKFIKKPKWIQGFSDPTGILYQVTTKFDIATIYGKNLGTYGTEIYDKSTKDSLEILKGNILKQESYEYFEEERKEKITGLESDNLTEKVEWKILNQNEVDVSGRILCGCYDLIVELAGTKYDGTLQFIEKYKNDGIIWFFDNCELSKEELIRTIWKLNELGYFKYTKAIIWGRNGVENSFLGYTMEECLKDSAISRLNIPIVYDADFSHKSPCLNIINGAVANVKVKNGKAQIEMKLE